MGWDGMTRNQQDMHLIAWRNAYRAVNICYKGVLSRHTIHVCDCVLDGNCNVFLSLSQNQKT